jgi:hypothetical protein
VPDYQIYRTNLTLSQASGLQTKYPFLQLAYASVFDPKDLQDIDQAFHAIPRTHDDHPSSLVFGSRRDFNPEETAESQNFSLLEGRALLSEDPAAPYWKKMISSPFRNPPLLPTAQDPPYLADDSLGRDTTIYIIDEGFEGYNANAGVCC